MTDRRLIEVAFPLQQASIDSVHEKNVRHGHISTLHLWPARRPLAASRAALVATLLGDPGTPEKRRELCQRLGGRVEKVLQRKRGPGGTGEERIVHETVGGVLRWGRETQNRTDLEFFRDEIRKAYGGRRPRVLDPFAGGGAIPLEAMRLGCNVTAVDINPVAWFILKCTLEYPQKLAGQKRPLPEFVRGDRDFMEAFFNAQGLKGAMVRTQLRKLGFDRAEHSTGKGQRSLDLDVQSVNLDADLAWHVRAWGWWVSRQARRELGKHYPIYADWQPLKDVVGWRSRHPDAQRPIQLVPLRDDGSPNVETLNATLSQEELGDATAPRWVAKPAVAYLWARTVTCKNCRATIPLLKTRWLAKKDHNRVLLRMEPVADRTRVAFNIETNVPQAGGNNAQRREHDKRLGQGTMSRSGAWCPCCGKPGTVAMESADIRAEAVAGRMDAVMTAMVVEGPEGKEYRLPTPHDIAMATPSEKEVEDAFASVPFGVPSEPVPQGGSRQTGGSPFTVHIYGIKTWRQLFTARQLLGLGVLTRCTREAGIDQCQALYPTEWAEALHAYLVCGLDRLLDFANCGVQWKLGANTINHSFVRYALPISWDYAEGNINGTGAGTYDQCFRRIATALDTYSTWTFTGEIGDLGCASATGVGGGPYDAIVTDPPYYDAIPYSDLMDFFYVWLRRSFYGASPTIDTALQNPLGPKWDHDRHDGELIDDASRHGGNLDISKAAYETGMSAVFSRCLDSLADRGRMCIVFANKQPDAWETLVGALIRSGFVVDGSWPIQTEQTSRMRALSSAALASSVWLVCRKREPTARAGWDSTVLKEMRENIKTQLREFWDAGIRGPDFVWAATGPALEAYSKHPVVKKANDPGKTMGVDEFLRSVRRLVVEFVVGRVLGEALHQAADAEVQAAAGLDDLTTYYLLHRHDFGMNDAPAGACILYALSCNLRESDLADRYGILLRSGGVDQDDDGDPDEGDPDAEGEAVEGSGSTFKLRPWKQRRRQGLGTEPVALNGSGRVVPLVDIVHRLMHLWVDGDVVRVNDYVDEQGVRRSEVFLQVLQALVELADEGSDERSVLERIMNHLQARGQTPSTLLDTLSRD